VGLWTDSSSSGQDPVAEFREHGNEHLGSKKPGNFLTS
jgi:hypothetical protein